MLAKSGGFSHCRRIAASHRLFSSLQETLKLTVGGLKYTLFRDDICKYPGSYFERALNENPVISNNLTTEVCRDGVLFRYINAYLITGGLPRNDIGQIDLDGQTLNLLKNEAEFFNLSSLKSECELGMKETCVTDSATQTRVSKNQPVSVVDFTAPVVNILSQVWRPLVTQGVVERYHLRSPLFKNNSVYSVDAEDLITAAKKISPAQSGPFCIDARFLSKPSLEEAEKFIHVANLFPDQVVELSARGLVIRTPECNYANPFEDSVPRVGTVELVLNSTFTGGELHVSSRDQSTVLQSAPNSWVAVHGDVSSFVSPVTSGARVSLTFDILPVTQVGQRLVVLQGDIEPSDLYADSLIAGVGPTHNTMGTLVDFALQLTPSAEKGGILHMDPFFVNASTISKLSKGIDLSSLFPNQPLEFRPKDVVIHRTHASTDPCNDQIETVGKGYLGTLVVILNSYFTGGNVRLCPAEKPVTQVVASTMSWYAFSADTLHQVEPVEYGTRVAIHYDIYCAKAVGKAHDPLDVPSIPTMFRTTVSPSVCNQVVAAVKHELTEADAVLITLQNIYAANSPHSVLQGGDPALCEMLSKTTDGVFDIQLGKVAIQCEYHFNRKSQKRYVLVLKSNTFTDTSGTSAASASNSKLIIPTKLTEQHLFAGDKYDDPLYHASALRVSKRK